jgi:anti-anti-sigma regulatory factor
VLGRARARARAAGGDLLPTAPHGLVRRILTRTGLTDVFSIHASVAHGPPDTPALSRMPQ